MRLNTQYEQNFTFMACIKNINKKIYIVARVRSVTALLEISASCQRYSSLSWWICDIASRCIKNMSSSPSPPLPPAPNPSPHIRSLIITRDIVAIVAPVAFTLRLLDLFHRICLSICLLVGFASPFRPSINPLSKPSERHRQTISPCYYKSHRNFIDDADDKKCELVKTTKRKNRIIHTFSWPIIQKIINYKSMIRCSLFSIKTGEMLISGW